MKIHPAGAAAALLALALPAPSRADDAKLTYESVTHCAAFNLLLAQVAGAGEAADRHKAEAESYTDQAAALMVVAAMLNKSTPQAVQADVTARNDQMIRILAGDRAGADRLVEDSFESCSEMGKAAKQAVDQVGKGSS